MKCKEYKNLISPYIDNMLDINEKEKLESHLEKCSLCREELRILEIIAKELEIMPDAKLPQDFHSSIMEKIKNSHKKEIKISQFNRLWIGMGVIAASVLIIAVSQDMVPLTRRSYKAPIGEPQISAPMRITPHEQNITFEIKSEDYNKLRDGLLILIKDLGLKEDIFEETTVAPENIRQLILEVNVPKGSADKFHDGIYKIFKKTNSLIENDGDIIWKFKNPEEKLIFYIQEVK